MIDRQAPSTPSAGMSMRRILVVVDEGPGRDGEEGGAGGEQHLDDTVSEVAGFVLAGGRHRSDQDLEQARRARGSARR